jgi:hypothetical protein
MKFGSTAVNAAQRLVAELDKRNTNAYVSLAKVGLWLAGICIVSMIVVGLVSADRSLVVQSAQALIFLCATVLGFHQYQGSRILHVLRNWNNTENKP